MRFLSYVFTVELLVSTVAAIIGIGVYMLTYWNWSSLPSGIDIADSSEQAQQFVAERALADLSLLTSRGPRVAGSETNERFAVEFLLTALEQIGSEAKPHLRVGHTVQRHTGSYYLDDEDYPITSYYRGVQNVIAWVEPRGPESAIPYDGPYLLLNAHFDSAVTSPGAGDDGTMVAVMLEVMRQLTQTDNGSSFALRHGVLFLFNGCEENTMQGAHAFASNHPLADRVVAFINLDVAANGGREIMFQSGPNYPFLMAHYRDHVKRPYANTLGEEVFQMGLVPSFTDYETLSLVGGWPGLDFALASYGYLYHTALDALGTISTSTLQHIGDNVLGLVMGLASSEELTNVQAHAEGTAVFFDFMHLFLVYYTETTAIIINVVLGVLAIGLIVGTLVMMIQQENASAASVLFEAGMALIVQTLSIVAGTGCSVLVAVIFDACSRSMSWFSSTWLLFGLYYVPFIACMTLGPFLYVRYRKISILHDQGRIILFLHAQQFIYAILLITLTIGGVRSAYLLLFPIIFYSATTIVNMILKFRLNVWLYVHLVGQLVPFVYFCSLTVTLFAVFISMTGRTDNRSNPDLQMALFSSLTALLLVSLLTPLVVLFRRKVYLYALLLAMFLVTGIVAATPVGFPFRERTSPQRYYIFHQERNFYTLNGTLRKSDSIFYLHPQDRHTPELLQSEVPEWNSARTLSAECERELYCGVPFYINRYHRQAAAESSYWLPASSTPNFPEPIRFRLVASERSTGRRILTFSVQGPSHMSLYISPTPGRRLAGWSFSERIPPSGVRWQGQDVHFVNLFSGNMDRTPATFELELETPSPGDGPDLHLSVVGQYMYHEASRTPEFQRLLDRMPPYAHTVAYPGYLESWIY